MRFAGPAHDMALMRLIAQSEARLGHADALIAMARETLRWARRENDRHRSRWVERQVLRELVEQHLREDGG